MKPTLIDATTLSLVDYRALRARAQRGDPTLPQALAQAQQRFSERWARRPQIRYAEGLPVSERAEEIIRLVENHQVVVVTGETGSGKTTQLPKICLAAGRGRFGLIGHTQPRRIAARSVADRIAKELGEQIGASVGFKVRFTDNTAPNAFLKLMTDGILLAETQTDKFLNAYDTIIIDEAHERSLNIDFLLGYLKTLLAKRADLKVVITSATIDAERFAQHFASADGTPAPLIAVSGRTFPVEIRYRPVNGLASDDEQEIEDAIADAVDECAMAGPGDVLVFLPGEREIRETMDIVRRRVKPGTEILPLFARLSNEEQQRIFHPSGNARRIVLATNVAETSLTVPGIRYVIDAGLARMSRYATRSKVQLLHIEKVSQASANQRAGRCGRVAAGVCIRLYDEDDFNARPAFTEPEILRSSLAAVILRLAALGFGKVETFPFLESPSGRAIADGYNELQELGALDGQGALTPAGRELARLPLEPRLGRMLLAAKAEGCVAEMLVIVAALSVPDPRERPMEAREAADRAHAKFDDDRSDFIALLNVWRFFLGISGGNEDEEKLSHRKQVQACRAAFLNWLRLREWRDIHRQLADTLKELSWSVPALKPAAEPVPAKPGTPSRDVFYEKLHRALLTGLTTNVGMKDTESDTYLGPRSLQFYVFPGSGVNRKGLKWMVAAELAETARLFARTVARVEPEWIEEAAQDRVSRHTFEPKWDVATSQVIGCERVSLHGLTLIARRRVASNRIDPETAREIFIREALVGGAYVSKADFLLANRALVKSLEEMEHRARRLDVLVDDDTQAAFYRQRIPLGIASAATFEKWLLEAQAQTPKFLHMTAQDLTRDGASAPTEAQFPKSMQCGETSLPLTYRFELGHVMDGVTVKVPLKLLNTLDERVSSWLVPGLRREKIAAMLKLLPKAARGRVQPIPDAVTAFLECCPPCEQGLYEALREFLRDYFQLKVEAQEWDVRDLSAHLMLNIRVIDDDGNELAMGRDLGALKRQLGQAAQAAFSGEDATFSRTGIKTWDLGTLPIAMDLKQGKQTLRGFPGLVDEGASVGIKLFDTEHAALAAHRDGLVRLIAIELSQQLRQWEKGPSGFTPIALQLKVAVPTDQLLSDFIATLCDRAFIADDPLPRDEKAYKTQLGRAKSRMQAVGEGLTRLLTTIATEYAALNQLLLAAPANARALVPVLKQWRDDLVYSGFLHATPWAQLQELPRYLRAAGRRLGKLSDYPLREQRHGPVVAGYKQRWREAVERARKQGTDAARYDEFRWLVEELHVSLFAQELKTPFPVSAKRLDKVWETLN